MTNKRLRVERIGPKTTKKRLRTAFETVGKVAKIDVRVDTVSSVKTRTAFVSFVTNGDAARAIAILNGTNLDDHEITVRWASASEHPRGQT